MAQLVATVLIFCAFDVRVYIVNIFIDVFAHLSLDIEIFMMLVISNEYKTDFSKTFIRCLFTLDAFNTL